MTKTNKEKGGIMGVMKTKVFSGVKLKEVETKADKFLAKNRNIEIKQCMTTEAQHGRRLMFYMTILYVFKKDTGVAKNG